MFSHLFQILIFVYPERGANFIQMRKIIFTLKRLHNPGSNSRSLGSYKKKEKIVLHFKTGWGETELDSRPVGHQPNALPTAPRRLV